MAFLVSTALAASGSGSLFAGDSAMSCLNTDFGMRALLQAKVGGPDCEGMCKKLGAYPNCQCPGFEGEPASSDDARACYVKYCQNEHCPTDAFTACVKELTKVSVLQWDALFSHIDQGLDSLLQ